MSIPETFTQAHIPLTVEGVQLNIATLHRDGVLAPIVFLHGFGSTKEDYADIVQHAAFAGHPFVAYDAPGCGESQCSDLSRISIPFLLKTALQMLEHFGADFSLRAFPHVLQPDRDVAADRRFSGERPSAMTPARVARHRCELFFSSGPCDASFKELI